MNKEQNKISEWADWFVDLPLQSVPCFLTNGFDFSMDQINFSFHINQKNLSLLKETQDSPFGKEKITITINNIVPSRWKGITKSYLVSSSINPRKELKKLITYDNFLSDFIITKEYLEANFCVSKLILNSLEFCLDYQTNVDLRLERNLNTGKQILHNISESLVEELIEKQEYILNPSFLRFDRIEYGNYSYDSDPLVRSVQGVTITLYRETTKRKINLFSLKLYEKKASPESVIRFEICLRRPFLTILKNKKTKENLSYYLFYHCRKGLEVAYSMNTRNKRKPLIQDFRNFFRKKISIFSWNFWVGGTTQTW